MALREGVEWSNGCLGVFIANKNLLNSIIIEFRIQKQVLEIMLDYFKKQI